MIFLKLFQKINIDDPPKIEVYTKKIILYNYKKIYQLKSNVIETREYILIGESLCIIQMNSHDLVIGGNLIEMKVKDNEKI